MDEILSAIGRLLGRLIGRNMDCGLDCDLSQLGWAEYLFLLMIFIAFFVATQKLISIIKKSNKKKRT